MESTYSNAVFDFVIFLPFLKHDSRAQIRQIFYDAMSIITGYTSPEDALAYYARGRRTAKNGIAFTYDSNGNLIKQSNGLEFLYDHTGVFAVKQGVSTYFYRKNAQNDIIALLDNTGTVVVKYKYNAWGKCQTTVLTSSASTIAELNPFRYRSYYFDTETNLYFLKTRYYDPEIGRFMTIDDISYLDPENINGLNLYAYCGNNPVLGYDPNGTFAITTAIIIGLIAGAVIGGTVGGVVAYNNASASGATGWSLVGQTALGVLGGAVVGGAIGALAGYAIGGLITALAPYIGAFLSSSFSILAPMMMDSILGYTVVATVTGAQIAAGAAVALGAGVLMFSKGSGARIGHNQHEKQMWEEAKRLRNIKNKDLARRIHDKLKQYPYAETLDDLLNVIDDILSRLGKR